MSNTYRLVWFQHFHKAAGTSVIAAAEMNNETLYPKHNNGNPLDVDGQQLRLWEYDADTLKAFIDECEKNNVSFIATEWGLPNIDVLSSDSRVTLISCLRDPLKRFVSNFIFDLHHGFTPARDLMSYTNTRQRSITMSNYYCRILSGKGNAPQIITQTDFNVANQALQQFDCVINLKHGLSPLIKFLDWEVGEGIHANKSRNKISSLLSLLLRGRWKLLYLRLRYPSVQPNEDFIQHYAESNSWDIALIQQHSM